MKKIAALIDFTPTCEVTITCSISLAKATGWEIVLVHITEDPHGTEEAAGKMETYRTRIRLENASCSTLIETGSFDSMIGTTLQLVDPEIVVTGTHGIHGLKQTLFGAHILKLAQSLSYPLLVVQDESRIRPEGIKNILFSMGPHEEFEKEIDFVASLAGLLAARVVIYTIAKSQLDITEELTHNNNYAKRVFTEKNIAFEHVYEESQDFSLGFSRQTLHFMEAHKFDLVVMASDPSERYRAFSNTDKENIILNTEAVPVLCV